MYRIYPFYTFELFMLMYPGTLFIQIVCLSNTPSAPRHRSNVQTPEFPMIHALPTGFSSGWYGVTATHYVSRSAR